MRENELRAVAAPAIDFVENGTVVVLAAAAVAVDASSGNYQLAQAH